MKFNILLIGSGGREHALARSLAQSESCGNLYAMPGNPGIEEFAKISETDFNDFIKIIDFCKQFRIDLVVIGPEQPLAAGLSDVLNSHGITVFGPTMQAARLESSKDFSKMLMAENNIPTASFSTFSSSEREAAHKHIDNMLMPIVLKADGLAAGKGVVICDNYDSAHNSLDDMFEGEFGSAGLTVLIEEFMYGQEASVFAICDGKDYLLLPSAQDHKKIGVGDKGKNTGGMGAYAPAPIVDDELKNKVEHLIIKPVLKAMSDSGNPYKGCLYVGLMIDKGNPKVVEFNARFGDPETQAVMQLVKGDVAKLFYSAAIGKLDKSCIEIDDKSSCVCIVLASNGYPDKFDKGFVIDFPKEVKDNQYIYHAGTKKLNGDIITNGGRVLGVTAIADTMHEAVKSAYELVDDIKYENKYFRNDIAHKAL